MFQCLGLGSVDTGGCGEDWWHPECVMGLPRDWYKKEEANKVKSEGNDPAEVTEDQKSSIEAPVPVGFPEEDNFDSFVCYKCVESNPWIKQYAGTAGFLPPVFKKNSVTDDVTPESQSNGSRKRKASEEPETERPSSPVKKLKDEEDISQATTAVTVAPGQPADSALTSELTGRPKHENLPTTTPSGTFSLFLKEDFRDHLCHCPTCFPHLIPHPQLVEEEDNYEPPLSDSGAGDDGDGHGPGSGARSQGTGSLLDRGEAALSTMDRVRAIEGVMAYNHLKDKVKEFLKPFAESGEAVTAEQVKLYFEKLRGDEMGGGTRDGGSTKANQNSDGGGGGDSGGADGTDGRKDQAGY